MSGYHELLAYPDAAIDGGWFRRPESASLGPRGEDTLVMLFHYAPGIYPLSAQASFSAAKAESAKVRMAKAEPATRSHKPTVGAMSTSGTGDAMAGSVGGAGVVLIPKK